MVALGLSTSLVYFVRVPPRPPCALDKTRQIVESGRAIMAGCKKGVRGGWRKKGVRGALVEIGRWKRRGVQSVAPVVFGSVNRGCAKECI